ncbi:hypothetical protein KI387_038240, partial [Taxus chinensis]
LPFQCRRCFGLGHTSTTCGMEKRQHEKCNWWKDALPEHLIFVDRKDLESKAVDEPESRKTPLSKTQVVSNIKNTQAIEGSMENDKYLSLDNNVAVPNGTNVTKENTPPLSASPTTKAPSGWIT